jgi:methyl-accepting chemotaxis protein
MRRLKIRGRIVLTIRSKLIAAFALVFVLLAGLGAFALLELETVNRTSAELGVTWLPSVRAVGNLNAKIAEFRIAEGAHLLAGTDEEKAKDEAEMKAIRDSIIESQGIFEPLIASEDEEAAYKAFRRLWGKYVDTDKEIIALSRQHQNDEANELFRGKAQEIFGKAVAKMSELVEVNARGAAEATASGERHYVFSRKLIIATIGAGAIISLLLAWLIVRSVSRPVTLMTGAMRRLGDGDKTIEVPGLSRKDEIGGMARALQVFKETALRTEALEAEQARERAAVREARAQHVESLTASSTAPSARSWPPCPPPRRRCRPRQRP